jgi:hypothetical protein
VTAACSSGRRTLTTNKTTSNGSGAGPMRWSGFDRDTNLATLASSGLEVVEHDIVEQTEPDGSTIHPLCVVARNAALDRRYRSTRELDE